MRSQTITTESQSSRKARHRMIALALGIFALAIPAAASASPVGGTGESSVNVTTGQSDEASQQSTGADYSSVNSITGGSSESSSTGSPQAVDSGYASPSAIAGPLPDRFTVASPAVGSPASSGEGFDWPSAAIGAGAAMALAAFGGAALLTVRRRTTVSPASTS
jgi:hypothetical protein